MGRKAKVVAPWFEYEAGLKRQDRERLFLRKYGAQGWGVYCMLLDQLCESEGIRLYDQDNRITFSLLAADCYVEPGYLREIIDYCLELNLFYRLADGSFTSTYLAEKLTPLMQKRKINPFKELTEVKHFRAGNTDNRENNPQESIFPQDKSAEKPISADGIPHNTIHNSNNTDRTPLPPLEAEEENAEPQPSAGEAVRRETAEDWETPVGPVTERLYPLIPQDEPPIPESPERDETEFRCDVIGLWKENRPGGLINGVLYQEFHTAWLTHGTLRLLWHMRQFFRSSHRHTDLVFRALDGQFKWDYKDRGETHVRGQPMTPYEIKQQTDKQPSEYLTNGDKPIADRASVNNILASIRRGRTSSQQTDTREESEVQE